MSTPLTETTPRGRRQSSFISLPVTLERAIVAGALLMPHSAAFDLFDVDRIR